MKYFKGKTILVTGAGGALGSLMSDYLLNAGATVIAVDITEGFLAGRKEKDLIFIKTDLSQPSRITKLAQEIKAKRKSVDILINNAGIVNGKPLEKTPSEMIQKALTINLIAPVLLVKEFEKDLEKNRGHVVNISSAAGIVGVSSLSDYCAAKFGLFGFDEAMRVEWKRLKKKISTTIICPYYLQTDMFKGVKTKFPLLLPIMTPEKAVERIMKSTARRKKRETFLFMTYSVWILRLLPVALFDAVSSFFGINRSMDEFVGKNGSPKAAAKKSTAKAPVPSIKKAALKKAPVKAALQKSIVSKKIAKKTVKKTAASKPKTAVKKTVKKASR